jgi:hypothetical protein
VTHGGAVALLCWAIHAADLVRRGDGQDLLWMCNVAALAAGVGMLGRRPRVVAGAAMALALGLPLWLGGLLTAGIFMPTALLTHVVTLGLAVRGARALGVPRGTWWRALAVGLALIALARVTTDPARNVNLAYAVWPGWERLFPSHLAYLCVLTALHAGAFAALERAARVR